MSGGTTCGRGVKKMGRREFDEATQDGNHFFAWWFLYTLFESGKKE